jgi:hypothetical protein
MSELINLMCSLIIAIVINTMTYVEELTQNEIISTPIKGKYEGNLVITENKSIAIMWRFETAKDPILISLMGPSSKSVATIPMQDLIVTNTKLNFQDSTEE